MRKFHFKTSIIFDLVVILFTTINYGNSHGMGHGHSNDMKNDDDFLFANVTMINIMTTREDEYAYVQYKLPDEELFIVGFTPLINSNVAHHMLTYACGKPGSDKPFWIQGGTCQSESMIIHGWGLNAPPLQLPEDVGFAVGKNTPYKYIVVNIHYLAIAKGDNSGNQIILSRKPRKYRAGIMLGGSGSIHLSPHTKTTRTPFSCPYNGPSISIFAVRVHAHEWARVNSLYRIRNGIVSQVTKGNPQWPQAFYPLPSPVQIENGDIFLGQCVYDNDDNRDIYTGSTHKDEMCNVYSMYSYDPLQTANGKPPIEGCWGAVDEQMFKLIPADSLIVPPNPPGVTITEHGSHHHGPQTGEPSNRSVYKIPKEWPVKKTTEQLGHVGGIALNNANNELVVFHRGTRKWEYQYFDGVRFLHEKYGAIKENVFTHVDTKTGQIKSQWGANMFYMPHGLTIDHRGNFWVTDIAMHQVFMFKSDNLTHPALVVGEKFQSGAGEKQFCRPADVAVMKNGDFFVADGYCNSRIVKFNQQGEFIKEWGTPMSGQKDDDGYPLPNEWNIVHSIALNEDAQIVCAADRENFRIQCFQPDTGSFLRQIHVESKGTSGAIYAIEFLQNSDEATAILFAVTGGPQTANEKIYMINAQNGETIGTFGIDSSMSAAHDITVSRGAEEIYVGQLVSPPGDVLHKFILSTTDQDSSKVISAAKTVLSKFNFISILLVLLVATFGSIFFTFIIYCVYRIIQLRKAERLNSYSIDTKNNRANASSILSNWINYRQQGFSKLEQDVEEEEEDQLLNSDEDSQTATSNDNDGAVRIQMKQKSSKFNNKNNAATLKLGDGL